MEKNLGQGKGMADLDEAINGISHIMKEYISVGNGNWMIYSIEIAPLSQ